jgi:hypothetical protein
MIRLKIIGNREIVKLSGSMRGWLEEHFGSYRFWIFVVACAYFLYALYFAVYGLRAGIELILDPYVYNLVSKNPWWWAILYYGSEGYMAAVACFLRVIAGCFALYSAFHFWRKKDLAIPRIRGKVGKALLFEACHFFTLCLSVIAAFVYFFSNENLYYFDHTPDLIYLYVGGISVLAMILIVSPVLLKLRATIRRGVESQEIIRWSCLTGIAYLFVVFWFNFSMSWAGTMVPYGRSQQNYGINFLLEPANLASFTVTVFGLFLIATFGLVSTLPIIRKKSAKINLRRIGAVILALGGYFSFHMFYYYLTGGFEAHSSVWYEVIGPLHNPYFWCLSLFFLGFAVLLRRNSPQT